MTRVLGVLAVLVTIFLAALAMYRLQPNALVHAVVLLVVGTLAGVALGVLTSEPSKGGGS